MIKKSSLSISPFIVLGFLILLAANCEKDNDNNPKNTVTDIDGNEYHTVTLGTQVWMVENLKTTKYRNGDPIPNVTSATEWLKLSTDAYCLYANSSNNGNKYGMLYNWYAVDDSRNIAPEGWHVPTDGDWTTLENYLIANGFNFDGTTTQNKIAKSLASTTGWPTSNVSGAPGASPESNNSTGFTALPGGYRLNDGSFVFNGEFGSWWSASSLYIYGGNYAWYRLINYNNSNVIRFNHFKQVGFSVRCIKDE